MKKKELPNILAGWLQQEGKRPFAYQLQAWKAFSKGESGIINAPTGSGKTLAAFLGVLLNYVQDNPNTYREPVKGLQLIWISPLRSLAKDIARALSETLASIGIPWTVAIRNGDTETNERTRQKKNAPNVLITTPESLHLLLAQKGYPVFFETLQWLIVDEWHELLGSKRGVQIELAVARLYQLATEIAHAHQTKTRFQVWGISATIGNLAEAKDVLLSPLNNAGIIVKAAIQKQYRIQSVFPDEIEKYPWAGHLGIKLAHKVESIIRSHKSTLIFINTRGMSETWYQTLLDLFPDLAGTLALHHGSIDQPIRIWVEEALHAGKLQAVVCTASLDLGVDFRPVEAVIQVGSPKGVGRFLQRAGRSGHQPNAESNAWFLPTHTLELLEASALKEGISTGIVESRQPHVLSFDVLIQFLGTLAVSEGFEPTKVLPMIRSTHAYRHMSDDEWQSVLQFLTEGGKALHQYDEYQKVQRDEQGIYRITSRKMAMRHRLQIGTIVSDAMIKVKLLNGGFIGVIEEWFISRLNPGDVFTLGGRKLELITIKDMTALVRKSNAQKSIVPSWMGGRMPLSSNLGMLLRQKLNDVRSADQKIQSDPELRALKPLFDLQAQLSHVPGHDELLIEHIETKDGFHLFVYPFEGRLVHEAMAALLAYRISRITPITFSFVMNDYGFELLSDQPIPLDDSNVYELFSAENLLTDIQRSLNATEMARRTFRDIAVIGGLLFQGMPGEPVKQRHLQSSASLLFNVFCEYDPDNILLRQAYREVLENQMEETRLRNMLERIQQSKIVIKFPTQLTPFCFPIKVDSLRETLSSEKLEDRVRRMQQQLNGS